MVTSHRTCSWSSTLGQLIFGVLTHIIALALPFMARLTKMCISPTEPLSYTATKLAFKLNKIFSVLRTVFNRNITTFRTDKFFSFKWTSSILSLVHSSHAIFSSSKIWTFALKAHKVGVNNHRILFWFPKVRRGFIFELWIILLQLFKLQSIKSHCLNLFI